MKQPDTSIIDEAGKINILLKRYGLTPSVTSKKTQEGGTTKYIVILKFQDGFTRSSLEAGGESTESPEEAYLFALQNFWRGVLNSIGG